MVFPALSSDPEAEADQALFVKVEQDQPRSRTTAVLCLKLNRRLEMTPMDRADRGLKYPRYSRYRAFELNVRPLLTLPLVVVLPRVVTGKLLVHLAGQVSSVH